MRAPDQAHPRKKYDKSETKDEYFMTPQEADDVERTPPKFIIRNSSVMLDKTQSLT